MEESSLIPNGGKLWYYLWALVFMVQYPKNKVALCSLLGSPDPKTARKWIWPFIEALYELGFYVVSEREQCMCLTKNISHRLLPLDFDLK